jgi:hypothetical protein
MPALPNVPNTLRVSLRYSTTGVLEAGNRLFFSYSGGPPTVGQLNTMATGVSAAFGTDLAGLMSSDYHLIGVTIVDLSSPTAAEGAWTGSVAGANSGHPPDIAVAMLQNFQISRRYRGGKCRTYWPFGVAGNLNTDDVTWTSAFLGTCATAWAAFYAAVQSISGTGITAITHVNVSYYHGFASVQNPVTKRWRNIPTPVAGPVTPDLIIGNAFRPEVSQQKRRRTSLS